VAVADTIANALADKSTVAEFHKMEEEAMALDPSCFKPTRGADGRLQPVLTLPGDTLETTPLMIGITTVSTATFLGVVAHGFLVGGNPLSSILSLALGGLAGEMFSGTFHWATDNYGDINTPVVGQACAAFQGHHLAPWTISHRSFPNNVYKIAAATIPLNLAGLFLFSPNGATVFATMVYCQVLAQEFHRWTHMPPHVLPAWQKRLQKAGVALPFVEHLNHHRPPFDRKYCILNGHLNGVLDSEPVLLWRRLEALVFRLTGVEPLSWKDPRCKQRALRTLPEAGRVPPPPKSLPPLIAKASGDIYLKLMEEMAAPREERKHMLQELKRTWNPDKRVKKEEKEIATAVSTYLKSVTEALPAGVN
jgi:ubiquitin-conjugating enzyme E2 variant